MAVELLQDLGMSQYEASIYVALLRLRGGTAREVSETTSVPRTRIYDAVERLQDRGLVDVQNNSPKQFQPVGRETTLRHFRHKYDDTVTELASQLADLEPAERQQEQRGVWTTTGSAAVDDRVSNYLSSATDEIVYLTIDRVLSEEILTELRAASERGVAVRLANSTETGHKRLQTAVPAAELIEPPWAWDGPPTGRLLVTDHKTVLMSTLAENDGSTETAIWGTGTQNSLVAVLTTIVEWWLG